jgi:hypothetical protein
MEEFVKRVTSLAALRCSSLRVFYSASRSLLVD